MVLWLCTFFLAFKASLHIHLISDHYLMLHFCRPGHSAMCQRNAFYMTDVCDLFFMVALCNNETIYIFMLFLLLLLFFPRLISAVGDWMFTILPHMVWP